MYKFKSHDKGLRVFKDGSIVAIFVNGKFETNDLQLALFLNNIEQIISVTPIFDPAIIAEEENHRKNRNKEEQEKEEKDKKEKEEKEKVKTVKKKKV